MKVKELKQIAESLGRFADIRESAKFPRDRLLVQAADGALKIVAMAPYGTLVSYVHPTQENFRAIIKARDFIQYVKSLPAKSQDLEITEANSKWERGIYLAGKFFERIATSVPADIILPPVEPQEGGYLDLTADEVDDLVKMVGGVAQDFWPYVQIAGEIVTHDPKRIRVACSDNYRWSARDYAGDYAVFGCVESKLIESMRGIGAVRIRFDPAGSACSIEAGKHRVYGRYYFLDYRIPLDGPNTSEISYTTVADRTALVKELRAAEKLDSRGRIWLQLNDDVLQVIPWDKASSGWGADSRLLINLLSGISAKKVGFGFRYGRGQPINVRIPNWTIEVAPVELVAQSTKKSTDTRLTTPQGIYVD